MSIKVSNVTCVVKNRKILDNVCFEINDGESVALVGPNGAGKTTVINSIMNFNSIYTGNITIDKKSSKLTSVHNRISFTPAEEIKDKIKCWNFILSLTMLEGYSKELAKKKILRMFKYFEIDNSILKRKFHQLSSGQVQIIKVILGLLSKKKYIIMDEPTNYLDPKIRWKIYQFIKKSKKTFFISSHNISEIKLLTSKLVLLDHGKVLYEGNWDNLPITKKTEWLKF